MAKLSLPIKVKRSAASGLLAALILAFFAANAAGWSLYCYFRAGGKELVLGAAQGTCHVALAEAQLFLNSPMDELFTNASASKVDLVDSEPLQIFAERSETMTPLSFRIMTRTDYRGIEFPWPLWLAVPLALFLSGRGESRRGRGSAAGSDGKTINA